MRLPRRMLHCRICTAQSPDGLPESRYYWLQLMMKPYSRLLANAMAAETEGAAYHA